VKRYGPEHGYQWHEGDVISASVITVPTAEVRRQQEAVRWKVAGMFGVVVLIVVGVFCLLFFITERKWQR
jgi:hypothetical protein